MDPQVQGSFIPKQALVVQSRGGGMGLLSLLAFVLFVLSIVAAGAAFGYKQLLTSQRAEKDASLTRAEGAFDSSSIQDLVRMDNRLIQARVLLGKHVSPSAVFSFLSTITLERVQFDSLSLEVLPDGGASIEMSGSADSFSGVALQSDQFGGSKVLKDVVFSGITIGEGGRVSFTVNATVDPQLILYSRNIAPPATEEEPQ